VQRGRRITADLALQRIGSVGDQREASCATDRLNNLASTGCWPARYAAAGGWSPPQAKHCSVDTLFARGRAQNGSARITVTSGGRSPPELFPGPRTMAVSAGWHIHPWHASEWRLPTRKRRGRDDTLRDSPPRYPGSTTLTAGALAKRWVEGFRMLFGSRRGVRSRSSFREGLFGHTGWPFRSARSAGLPLPLKVLLSSSKRIFNCALYLYGWVPHASRPGT